MVSKIFRDNQERLLDFKSISTKVRRDMNLQAVITQALFPKIDWRLNPLNEDGDDTPIITLNRHSANRDPLKE